MKKIIILLLTILTLSSCSSNKITTSVNGISIKSNKSINGFKSYDSHISNINDDTFFINFGSGIVIYYEGADSFNGITISYSINKYDENLGENISKEKLFSLESQKFGQNIFYYQGFMVSAQFYLPIDDNCYAEVSFHSKELLDDDSWNKFFKTFTNYLKSFKVSY